MEKWNVIGYRKVDFKDGHGNNVQGYTLYLSRPASSSSTTGLEAQKMFISCQYVDYIPKENEMVNISFNRYGKVESVTPCEV